MQTEISKKVAETVEAYREAQLRDTQYNNMLRINHCLPKRKEKLINELTTPYIVRKKNTDMHFQRLYKKLTREEYTLFRKLIAE